MKDLHRTDQKIGDIVKVDTLITRRTKFNTSLKDPVGTFYQLFREWNISVCAFS